MEEMNTLQDNSQALQTRMRAVKQTPDEAVKNIENADFFDMEPEAYSNVSAELDEDVAINNRIPAQVGNATTQFLNEDSQNLAASQNGISFLDNVEKRLTYYKNSIIDIPEKNRRISELRRKQIFSTISEDEADEIEILNLDVEEMQARRPDDLGDVEQFGVDVASGTGDIVRMYTDNAGTIAGFTTGGALAGGALGSVVPGAGTLAGAKVGAVKGFLTGTAFAGYMDAFNETTGLMYNQLARGRDEEGNALNLTHEKMSNVSVATGVISGLAGALAGKALSKSNPLFKKFASPKLASQFISKSPKIAARLDVLGGLAKSALAEGSEEGFQEFINIVGEQFAQIDDTEESFINTIDNIAQAAGDSLNIETFKQVAYSGAVGAGAGSTFQAVQTPLAKNAIEEKYRREQKLNDERKQTLQNQNLLLEMSQDIKNAKQSGMKDVVTDKFMSHLYSFLEVDQPYYITPEDAEAFADTPEKKAAVEQLLMSNKDSNETVAEVNVNPELDPQEVAKTVAQFPELSDHIRTKPDGESPAEIRSNAELHLSNVEEAQKKANELLNSLGADAEITAEVEAEIEKIAAKTKDPRPFENEFDYLDSVTVVEQNGALTKKQVEDINLAHLEARLKVSEELRIEANEDFDVVENKIIRDVKSKQLKEQVKYYEGNLNVVDRFTDRKNNSEAARAVTANHEQKGFSPSAIDPDSLPEDLREMYLNNKNLKKRKVFVKGGIDIEESAVLNGVDSGAKLLEILADTPTKTELRKLKDQDKIRIENNIRQTLKRPRQSKVDAAFGELSKVYAKQLKTMVDTQWTDFKRGVIKIAKTPPSSAQLNQRAKSLVSGMKLRTVNPNKFVQGERKSRGIAVKSYVEGKFEQAYANMEKAALNNELRREAINAKKQIQRNKKFWENSRSKSNQNALKKAGYQDAFNDLVSVFRLDGNNRGAEAQQAYNDYVKKQVALGNVTFDIPDHLQDVRMTIDELTVDQYNEITEKGRLMLNQAKLKNKLMNKFETIKKFKTIEMLAQEINESTTQNPFYDEKKAQEIERDPSTLTPYEKAKSKFFKTAAAGLSNLNFIALEADGDKVNGPVYRYIADPLVRALQAERKDAGDIKNSISDKIKQYYGSLDKWTDKYNDFLRIPELSGVIGLGDDDGNIRKIDLMMLQAYRGDADNVNRFENYIRRDGSRLTVDEVESILDTHLTIEDADFVQDVLIGTFEQFKERAFALHEKTTGERPQEVGAREFVHKGKTYKGGYFPTSYKPLANDIKNKKFLDKYEKNVSEALGKSEDSSFFSEQRAAEMTKQGRYKERQGSNRALDARFENFFTFVEEMIHDLNFREPTIDALNLLSTPSIAKDITSVVGQAKFEALSDSVRDAASKTSQKNAQIFVGPSGVARKIVERFNSLHAIKVLGFNMTSVAKQPASLLTLTTMLGPKGFKYVGHRLLAFSDPFKWKGFTERAIELNPDIKAEQDNIDDTVTGSTYREIVPTSNEFFKKYKKTGKAYNKIKALKDRYLVDNAFAALQETDKAIRIVATLAIEEQFFAGDIEGFPMERINKMSPEEQDAQVKKVIRQITRSTLTASSILDKTAFEKDKNGKLFIRYFTDVRSNLNGIFSQSRRIGQNIKKGEYTQATSRFMFLSLMTYLTQEYMESFNTGEEEDKDETISEVAMGTTFNFLIAPVNQTISSLPVISNVKYAVDAPYKSRYRNVSIPALGVASDIATATLAMKDLMEDGLAMEDVFTSDFNVQNKALLAVFGYLSGGLPTNAFKKALERINDDDTPTGAMIFRDASNELISLVDQYSEKFKDNQDAQPFIKDMKEFTKTLRHDETNIDSLIDEDTQPIFQEILSGGQWNKVDEDTGAAGLYQFTEEQWNNLMETEPDLGLTEDGRVAKDQDEQEVAMEFMLKENALTLQDYGVEVTTENLLGSHIFGVDNMIAIQEAKANTKLSTVLGKAEANKPIYKNLTTVKSLRKHLSNLLTN